MRDIGCYNCKGACCTKNMRLILSASEVETLTESKTVVVPLLPANPQIDWSKNAGDLSYETPFEQELVNIASRLKIGLGYYSLLSDCGYLSEPDEVDGTRKCTIFNDPKRPEICSSFPEGGQTCQNIRLTRGVWDFE